MRKIIPVSLVLASVLFIASMASAQAGRQQGEDPPQHPIDRNDQNASPVNRNDNRRREWTETKTRTIGKGNKLFRETIQIKHLRNGKTQIKVINRKRIR